jgi:hypothetical protein
VVPGGSSATRKLSRNGVLGCLNLPPFPLERITAYTEKWTPSPNAGGSEISCEGGLETGNALPGEQGAARVQQPFAAIASEHRQRKNRIGNKTQALKRRFKAAAVFLHGIRRKVARTCSIGPRLFVDIGGRTADLKNRSALRFCLPVIGVNPRFCPDKGRPAIIHIDV